MYVHVTYIYHILYIFYNTLNLIENNTRHSNAKKTPCETEAIVDYAYKYIQ